MALRSKTRRGSPLHVTPATELFSVSKKLVLSNIWVFGPLYILPFLFLLHSWLWNLSTVHGSEKWYLEFQNKGAGFNSGTLPAYTWGYFVGFFSVVAIIMITISVIVQIMTNRAQLDAAEGRTPSFQRSWEAVKQLGWRLFGLYIVSGIVIFVGFILLIIPGLMLYRRLLFAPYVMLDEKCGIREAMDKSAEISSRYPSSVWTVIGVTLLIALVGIVPFIGALASFILGFLYSVAFALRYTELKKLSPNQRLGGWSL
jgi:hypothetical protein